MSPKHLSALSNMFFKLSIIGMYQVSSIYWKKKNSGIQIWWCSYGNSKPFKDWKKIFNKILMQHCGKGGIISEGAFNLVLPSIKNVWNRYSWTLQPKVKKMGYSIFCTFLWGLKQTNITCEIKPPLFEATIKKL